MDREDLSQVQNSTFFFRDLRIPVCTKPHFQSKKGSIGKEDVRKCPLRDQEGFQCDGCVASSKLLHFSEPWVPHL